MSKNTLIWGASVLLLSLGGAGCGDDDASGATNGEGGGASGRGSDHDAGDRDASTSSPDGGIEVAGAWSSEYGDEVIDDTMWNGASIVRFDNAMNEVVTQDPSSEDDAGVQHAGAFNKIVWTEPKDDAFFYCWVAFGEPSAEAADDNAMPADDSDPGTNGCGDAGFPWTKLERK